MMECKKALVETNGDFKAAEELMRIKSGAKASKAATRVTAEGVIGSFLAADGKSGAVAEVNCETDFVAKNDDFMAFARNVAQTVAQKNPADVEALLALPIANGSGTVEETRKALVMKLGENLSVRRFERYETSTGKTVDLPARQQDRRDGELHRRRRCFGQGSGDAHCRQQA